MNIFTGSWKWKGDIINIPAHLWIMLFPKPQAFLFCLKCHILNCWQLSNCVLSEGGNILLLKQRSMNNLETGQLFLFWREKQGFGGLSDSVAEWALEEERALRCSLSSPEANFHPKSVSSHPIFPFPCWGKKSGEEKKVVLECFGRIRGWGQKKEWGRNAWRKRGCLSGNTIFPDPGTWGEVRGSSHFKDKLQTIEAGPYSHLFTSVLPSVPLMPQMTFQELGAPTKEGPSWFKFKTSLKLTHMKSSPKTKFL